MKKLLIFAMAIGLAACTKDGADVNGAGAGEFETNYLSVNLVSAIGTRADAYESQEGYENGTEDENDVKNVRFYFFDASKEAAIVTKDGKSYFDWTENITGDDTDAPNVERILDATIVLNVKKGDETKDKGYPEYIVAVLNIPAGGYDDFGKTTDNCSLANLLAVVDEFSYNANNGFLMSNAVYTNDGSTKAVEVSVAGHIYPTETVAKENPVKIHVERVLAKATLTFDINNESKEIDGEEETSYKIYKAEPTDPTADDLKYGDKQIYIRPLGWEITTTAKTSYLLKNINPGWANAVTDITSSENLFKTSTEPWNYKDFFRSYWALNPTGFTYPDSYDFLTFDDFNNNYTFDGNTYAYMPENASNVQNGDSPVEKQRTQVIIAAQLVDEDGEPLEFAEYNRTQYTIEDLKVVFANLIKGKFYKQSQSDQSTGYADINVDDFELVTATDAGEADANTPGRYYVYAKLTEDAETYTWTTSNAEEQPEGSEATVEDVNNALIDLGHAKVWTEGYTYFYFDLRHLSASTNEETTPGYYGVVRNHVYASTITSLKGLGTPVYNPDEVIYPEKTEEDETFLAAEIRILSWRIVSNSYDLEW